MKIIASAKVEARAVLLNKSTGFGRMSVTARLLRLGALLRDNLQVRVCSVPIGVFCLRVAIIHWAI